MKTLADGVVHFLDLLAGGDGAQAGEQLGLQVVADKSVERVGTAILDAVGDGGDALGVVGFADGGHFGGEPLLELVLEGGDAVEHGGVGGFLIAGIFEGVLDERLAQVLHERVGLAGRVVDVGEHGLVVHDAQQILLGEAGGEKRAVGAHEKRLLGNLAHNVLHRGLHGLLDVAEVDGLAESHQERGAHELEDFDGFLGLASGHQSERVHILVVLLRALDMGGDRVGQVVELGQVGRHGDLGPLHPVVQARVRPAAQVGRQPVVVEIVDELGELREHELADGGDGQPHVVHGHSDRRALEVASVHCPVSRRIDQRVVVHRVDLPLNGMRRIPNHLHLK